MKRARRRAKLQASLLGCVRVHRHCQGSGPRGDRVGEPGAVAGAWRACGNRRGLGAGLYVAVCAGLRGYGRSRASAPAIWTGASVVEMRAISSAGRNSEQHGHVVAPSRACGTRRWSAGRLSRELHLRTGDDVEAANGTNNVAEVLSDQGHIRGGQASGSARRWRWKAAGWTKG